MNDQRPLPPPLSNSRHPEGTRERGNHTDLSAPAATRGADAAEPCVVVGIVLDERRPSGPSGVSLPGYSAQESLAELKELAVSAGAEVVAEVVQARDRYDPATLIGSGKAGEVAALVAELGAQLVLFDHNLTPTQQRNLERRCDCRVIDRTQLILDIFARHARTKEGKLQVELAQLTYLLPRLTGRGVQLSRLGGGIGTRGPGETQLETDRRRIGRRIDKLKDDLEKVRQTRQQQRKKRIGVPLSTIALVGYTNAGKSTLFNALTAAGVVADARMFATLDPTIRVLDLPSHRRVLLSDTVGFIRDLPPHLVKSFRATLEEVTQSAVILHVADLSSPQRREHMEEVHRLLGDLDAASKPQILVMNKSDRMSALDVKAAVAAESETHGGSPVLAVSARNGDGLAELLEAIDRLLPGDRLSEQCFHFPYGQGDAMNFLYEHARVLARRDTDEGVDLVADVPDSVVVRLRGHLRPAGEFEPVRVSSLPRESETSR